MNHGNVTESTDDGLRILLPMDQACLEYLVACGGEAPSRAIPARLFRGEIPEGTASMVHLGLIEHRAEITRITEFGRFCLAASGPAGAP